ncbi:MAG: glycosyltransferase family 61 protein [Methylacidiphilales bacterium]|nr:glycosyltransferase family 61 protein [Candidatus Methylacidiphilales bacterium]
MKNMRKAIREWIVLQVLRVYAVLSRFVQVGNPHGRAPTLMPAPSEEETLGTFEGGKVYLFRDAMVSGRRGGLVVSNRNQFFANLTYYHSGSHLHPSAVPIRVPTPEKLKGTGAYLCTPQADGNYYHWMIDLVPRLWLLEQAGFTPRNLDYVFVNGENRAWEKETLLAYGFRPEQICNCTKVNRYQIERLAVPDIISNCKDFYRELEAWRIRFLQRLFPVEASPQRRRLFCGRKKATWRRLLNEDALYARLEPLGFLNVNCDGMTVSEQARLFSSASQVVAVHGSMLTNSLFLQEDAFVIEIKNRSAAPDYSMTNIYTTRKCRSSIILAEPTRQAGNDYDTNHVDILISSSQMDAIISLVEKNSVP